MKAMNLETTDPVDYPTLISCTCIFIFKLLGEITLPAIFLILEMIAVCLTILLTLTKLCDWIKKTFPRKLSIMNTPTTPTTVVTSKRFSLNWLDAGKSLAVATLTPAVYYLYNVLSEDSEPLNWKKVYKISLTAGVGYLIKNFLSPAQTIIQPPIGEKK